MRYNKHMNILLVYYTGTYNTRYVSEKLRDGFLLNNNSVDLLEVNKDTKPIDLSKYSLIGLGYPIYAFNSPTLFNKFLKRLKLNSKAKYFIYKNSGETLEINNSSSRVIFHILKKNNCICQNEYHIVMPYTIHFKFESNFVKEILSYLDKQIKIINYDLAHGVKAFINTNWKIDFVSRLYTIQRVGGFVNSMFYKVDYSKCIHCDLCVNNCPVHNIKKNKKKHYIFGRECQMCMRCSYTCPENAIKIGLYDKWRVNGPYDFRKIEKDNKLDGKYINGSSKDFYECFIKTFKDIDIRYNEIIGNK